MHALYIRQCADGTLYTGITVNLARRVREHNYSKLGSKYTRARRPVKLVFSKKFKDRSQASKEEARIKNLSHKEKLSMIELNKHNFMAHSQGKQKREIKKPKKDKKKK